MKHVSTFLWQGLHSEIRHKLSTYQPKLFKGLQAPENHQASISIIPRAQSLKDADRRDALKRGGV